MGPTSATGQRFSSMPNYYDYTPSAPPMEERQPDLNDKCAFCLDTLKEYAEGDTRAFRWISKTECNHFFHDFCLQEFLINGTNKNCPMCRTSLKNVTKINLDEPKAAPMPAPRVPVMQVPAPLQPVYQPVKHQPIQSQPVKPAVPQGPGAGERLLWGTVSVAGQALKWSGSMAWNATRIGFNYLMTEAPVADNHFDKRSINILSKLPNMLKSFENSVRAVRDDELSMVLALINSTAAAGTHKKGEASLVKIEQSLNLFEAQLKGITNEFKKALADEKKKFS